MKKKVKGVKLSRGQGARRALFRALISALITEGKIVTTYAKAKAIRGQVDKLVNLAKGGSVAKKRQVYKILGNDRKTLEKLFNNIVPNFSDTTGGYTRIIILPRRRGDFAEMASIEWVKEIVKSQDKKGPNDKEKKPVTRKPQRDKKSIQKKSANRSGVGRLIKRSVKSANKSA